MARKSSVKTFQQFPRVTRAVEELARRSVEVAAREGAAEASRRAAARRRTGTMQDMEVVHVQGTADGYAAGFRSKAWYSLFQNDGTRGSRTRKVKSATLRRRASASGQARAQRAGAHPGIVPLRFFEAGQRVGREAMLRETKRGI